MLRFRILRIGKQFKIQRRYGWLGWRTVEETFGEERYARAVLRAHIARLVDLKQPSEGTIVYATQVDL